jgi:2-dehydropantoate 2-reductase
VAVVGVGAIGSVFAAAAAESGRAALALCVRPGRGPVTVEGPDGQRTTLAAGLISRPQDAGGPADWIFLAVKAHQTAGAAAWLAELAGPASTVVVLQNGVEHRERVAGLADGAAVLPAVVWCPSDSPAAGQVRQHGPARLVIPAGPEGRRLQALLAGTRAQVELTDDFLTVAWQKLTLNAVTGLMALAGQGPVIYGDQAVAGLARRLAAECVAVGRAAGAQLPDGLPAQVVDSLATRPAGVGSSILADRLAGRPLEWDARNGVIQRLGATYSIPTPVSDVVVPLLAAASQQAGGPPGALGSGATTGA